MVSVNIEVETTRAIARQLLRHRSFSFQEFSARYADPTKDLGFVICDARLQDLKNRQNSVVTEDKELLEFWDERQREVISKTLAAYKWGIDNGIAKEVCRSVLPEGNTLSRLYVHGTLRSWIHYCELRCANGTQLEHMDLATKCWQEIQRYFPTICEAVEIKT
jgi:thymidylate synthase (FAD)